MIKVFWPQIEKDWKEMIHSFNKLPLFKPFDEKVLTFFQTFSKFILKDIQFRQYPELISLAFWLRRSNLSRIEREFTLHNKECLLKARGTVLQFAPGNVDTIFIYSWALSLLAGNRSMIRISSKQTEQSQLLIYALVNCFNLPENIEVSKRVVILTYDYDEETTGFLSKNCHVRVIWGGDRTVKAIRSVPLAPIATEIVFPDRFSLSIFKASKILSIKDDEMKNLIHQFYNDSYWFGQMACSSPRLIVWEGNEPCIGEAKERFWIELEDYVSRNYTDFSPAIQVEKFTTSFLLGVEKEVTQLNHHHAFSRVQITSLPKGMRDIHCGGGLFLEWETNDILNLPSILEDKDQTITYFGFEKDELIRLVDGLENRGVDRIVPIGQALNFEDVWDGYRLLTYFTREVIIK